jgi:hypothetical protein
VGCGRPLERGEHVIFQAVALNSNRNGIMSAFGALQSLATNETHPRVWLLPPSPFLFRNGNAFIHEPFHRLFAKECLQKYAKLHRAKPKEFDDLAQILLGQRSSGEAVLVPHLYVWCLQRDRVLFRVPQKAIVVEGVDAPITTATGESAMTIQRILKGVD